MNFNFVVTEKQRLLIAQAVQLAFRHDAEGFARCFSDMILQAACKMSGEPAPNKTFSSSEEATKWIIKCAAPVLWRDVFRRYPDQGVGMRKDDLAFMLASVSVTSEHGKIRFSNVPVLGGSDAKRCHVCASPVVERDSGEGTQFLIADVSDDIALRKLLWLHHRCSDIRALYGDDGEMQCNTCMVDFKRDSPKLIEKKLRIHAEKEMKDGKA